MATSVYPATGGMVGNTDAATFIPEIWSDEVIAAYEKSLVLAPLTKKISMSGKKGDTIHIPAPTRGTATAKAENTAVTIQNATESEVTVTINKHFEYSRMIEDITNVQALASLRQFYTGDAGYALGKQVDDDLFTLGKSFGDGNGTVWTGSGTFYNDVSTGTTAYADDTVVPADVFADTFLRDMIQKLDDADVPMDGRSLIVPPALRNAIMGIDRYVSSDFVNGQGVMNGKIGELYGVDIYVSTNCPTLETAAENAATAGGIIRGAMLCHKDTMVLAEQQGIRSQTQYKQEFLGTLYTADRLYGTQVLRPEAGFIMAVNG
jgi:N4-gp56 family major capsid protein